MGTKRKDPVYKKVKISVAIDYWIYRYLKENEENKSKLINNLIKQYIYGKK